MIEVVLGGISKSNSSNFLASEPWIRRLIGKADPAEGGVQDVKLLH